MWFSLITRNEGGPFTLDQEEELLLQTSSSYSILDRCEHSLSKYVRCRLRVTLGQNYIVSFPDPQQDRTEGLGTRLEQNMQH